MTPAALDIAIACILLLSGMVAYFRGIIREAFTIVALVAATGAAYFGGSLMEPAFRTWLHVKPGVGEQAAHAVSKAAGSGTDASIVKSDLFMGVIAPEKAAVIFSYLSVFVFIYLVMTLIGFFLTRAVNESGLSVVDRLLGLGFGLARGFLLVFLFYVPVHLMMDYKKYPDWAKNSISVPILEESAVYADAHLDIAKFIENRGNQLVVKLKKPELDGKDDKDARDEAAPAASDTPAPVATPGSSAKSDADNGYYEPPDDPSNRLSNEERDSVPQIKDLP
jgi:membrane protein required for colicin V production